MITFKKNSFIIDKGEYHEDYVRNFFWAILSEPNSISSNFFKRKQYDWDTGSEVLASDLIKNATENQNKMVSAK